MSMTRTPNLHEEDTDEAEDVAAGTDTSSHREGKSAEQRPNNYRSKHSETEQRRRSKINERFQLLREIIPPNDQKRDKASLLLEVIKYIQFLQEKLQVYEGSYEQVWTQEATKLIPWRANNGGVDNFGNQCQAMKNGSMDEENLVHPMTDSHGLLESEFSEEFAYGGADHLAGPTTPAVPFNIPLQSCGYAAGRSILPTENIVSQPEYPVLGMEGRAIESTSSGISNVYSQGLLKKLTQALQTSGVDLSQTNISVQLDIGKRENNGSVVVATAGDVGNRSPTSQLRSHTVNINGKESFHAVKRFKTGES